MTSDERNNVKPLFDELCRTWLELRRAHRWNAPLFEVKDRASEHRAALSEYLSRLNLNDLEAHSDT